METKELAKFKIGFKMMNKKEYMQMTTTSDKLEDFMFDLYGSEYIKSREKLPIQIWPFIPRVKRIVLKNVGPIRKLSAEFAPGLNLVCGRGGSGKTILLECLHSVLQREGLDQPLERLKSCGSKEALIEIETFPAMRYCFEKHARLPGTKNSETLSQGEKKMLVCKSVLALAKPYQAVLLDDPFQKLDIKNRKKLLRIMAESKQQIITTTKCLDVAEEAEEKFGANIIWSAKACKY